MTDVAASALAAAVAAAAELAMNGGAFLFHAPDGTSHVLESTTASSMVIAEELYAREAGNEEGKEKEVKMDLTTTTTTTTNCDSHSVALPENYLEEENDDDEPDGEKRLARSRERNREHARRTRLRKKAQLEALQAKVKGLEAESRTLRLALEECNIASILVGLSSGASTSEAEDSGAMIEDSAEGTQPDESKIALLITGKRKRFISDDMLEKNPQPFKLRIDGQTTLIGGAKTHINWKTGVYSDETGAHRQLTSQQLESLRRERNRMHAKMTRDRKKCFIKTIESTIDDLERENKRLRDLLSTKTTAVTPQPSPMLSATEATHAVEEAPLLCSSSSSSVASSPCPSPALPNDETPQQQPNVVPSEQPPRPPKVTHGFSLIA